VVITIFGVGYGEVRPIENTSERIFTIFVILAGTSSALYIVGGFVQMVAEGEITRAFDAQRKENAIAERLKFSAYIIIAILVSGIIYPLFGHWVWNDAGWLKQLGFVDFAGGTVVHGVGALVSLAALIIIGSRLGRFDPSGKVNKIQGANLPFAVLGALLLWLGWLGFNGGSTLN
jgi:hypothetical protein